LGNAKECRKPSKIVHNIFIKAYLHVQNRQQNLGPMFIQFGHQLMVVFTYTLEGKEDKRTLP